MQALSGGLGAERVNGCSLEEIRRGMRPFYAPRGRAKLPVKKKRFQRLGDTSLGSPYNECNKRYQ